MTKKYKQLTLDQRYKIEALHLAGKSQTFIAKAVDVNKSTISGIQIFLREGQEQKSTLLKKRKRKQISVTLPNLSALILPRNLRHQMYKWITQEHYSPELVAAQWKKRKIKGVSHEWIYQFIWYCKHTNKRTNSKFKMLYKYLKHGRRRQKGATIKIPEA